MSTPINLNALLSLPEDFKDELAVGNEYTDISFTVLKLFSDEESRVFSENFLRY